MSQLSLDGLPVLPPARKVGRPAKAKAKEHSKALRKAVLAGVPKAIRHKRPPVAPERADWLNEACRHVLAYAREAGSGGFLMEEARFYALGLGLPAAPEPRLWGSVPQMLRKGSPGNRLEAMGADRAKTSHYSFKVRWRIA